MRGMNPGVPPRLCACLLALSLGGVGAFAQGNGSNDSDGSSGGDDAYVTNCAGSNDDPVYGSGDCSSDSGASDQDWQWSGSSWGENGHDDDEGDNGDGWNQNWGQGGNGQGDDGHQTENQQGSGGDDNRQGDGWDGNGWDGHDWNGNGQDGGGDFDAVAAPEPASAGLWAAGLCALTIVAQGWWRRGGALRG